MGKIKQFEDMHEKLIELSKNIGGFIKYLKEFEKNKKKQHGT